MSNTSKLVAVLAVLAVAGLAWALNAGVFEKDISSYYPLKVGNTWSYDTKQRGKITGGPANQESERTASVEQRVVGLSRLSSDQLEVFEVSQTSEVPASDTRPASTAQAILHVSAAPSEITLHAVDFDDPNVPGLSEPVVILTALPATDPVTAVTGSLTMLVSIKSQETEAVEVPAGNFPNALKKHAEGPVSGTVSGARVDSGTVKETTWFVRDVGIVKQERLLEYTVGQPGGAGVHVQEATERVLTKRGHSPTP